MIWPIPMPKTVCRTLFQNSWVQYEVCRPTFLGVAWVWISELSLAMRNPAIRIGRRTRRRARTPGRRRRQRRLRVYRVCTFCSMYMYIYIYIYIYTYIHMHTHTHTHIHTLLIIPICGAGTRTCPRAFKCVPFGRGRADSTCLRICRFCLTLSEWAALLQLTVCLQLNVSLHWLKPDVTCHMS